MPSTKQIESSTFDLPEPLRPVIALNSGSKPVMTVRFAYDLKPSRMISRICMAPHENIKRRKEWSSGWKAAAVRIYAVVLIVRDPPSPGHPMAPMDCGL